MLWDIAFYHDTSTNSPNINIGYKINLKQFDSKQCLLVCKKINRMTLLASNGNVFTVSKGVNEN